MLRRRFFVRFVTGHQSGRSERHRRPAELRARAHDEISADDVQRRLVSGTGVHRPVSVAYPTGLRHS